MRAIHVSACCASSRCFAQVRGALSLGDHGGLFKLFFIIIICNYWVFFALPDKAVTQTNSQSELDDHDKLGSLHPDRNGYHHDQFNAKSLLQQRPSAVRAHRDHVPHSQRAPLHRLRHGALLLPHTGQ